MTTAPTSSGPSGLKPRRRPGEFSGGGRKFTPRRKVCTFCVDKVDEVDYKDVGRLRRFLSERGKIEPRRKTGTCARHQRSLNTALKRARHLALLPFTAEHIRVTGVLVREPLPPRGPRMPRPVEGAPATEAAAEPAPSEPAAAEPAATPQPSPASPETFAESPAAEGAQETPEQTGSASS